MAVDVRADVHVVAAAARRAALAAGFSVVVAGEIAIVASELASNALNHGGGGVVAIDVDDHALAVVADDHGAAGPVDAAALVAGALAHSHLDQHGRLRAGLGQGINAVRRLAPSLDATRHDRGLRVTARWPRPKAREGATVEKERT